MFAGIRRALADLRTMRTLLPAAERIAHADGLAAPAAEHLVLAALDAPDGSARRALEGAGLDAARLRGALDAQAEAALAIAGVSVDRAGLRDALPEPPAEPRGVYHSEPSLQAVFGRVRLLARADGAPMHSAYVLLAATELEHGPFPRALSLLGVSRDSLAALARGELEARSRRPAGAR